MILAIRTDKPEAELYLLDENAKPIDEIKWQGHRELSNTLLNKVESLLSNNNISLKNLTGIVVYKGPGSFTGLRIGISVANTMAYSLGIALAGSTGDDWVAAGRKELKNTKFNLGRLVKPEYGAEAHITKPRK